MNPEWESAVTRGDAASVAAQIASGINVDSLDRYGQSALMLAAHRGHLEVVRLLLHAGAHLDRTAKFGLSALMLAALAGHETIARELAAAGANLRLVGSGAPGFSGKTAAQLALARGLAALAEDLSVE